jgi:hypothetical protein
LKIKLKGILRDKSDVFNSKGGHEDKVKYRKQIIVSWILTLLMVELRYLLNKQYVNYPADILDEILVILIFHIHPVGLH